MNGDFSWIVSKDGGNSNIWTSYFKKNFLE